jgi:predicted nucleotidyltransferase
MSRVATKTYGPALTVHFASRYDLTHFKLHAFVDRGDIGGKHGNDLLALAPDRDELVAAARWTTTHDPSPGYREMLERALEYLGVEDADLDA